MESGFPKLQISAFARRHFLLEKETKGRESNKALKTKTSLELMQELITRETVVAKSTKINYSHITESLVN